MNPMTHGLPDAAEHAALRSWDDCLRVGDAHVHWLQRDPDTGRSGLMRQAEHGSTPEAMVTAPDVRSEVQGYGGGAFCLAGASIVFVDGGNGSVRLLDPDGEQRTLVGPGPHVYGDLAYDAVRQRVIGLRETSSPETRDTFTDVVAIPLEGSGAPAILASGTGFHASPRPSPCGRFIAWIRWDVPHMPWNESALEIVALDADGVNAATIATIGGRARSVIEPAWAEDGTLFYLDDVSGWWNPWTWRAQDGARPVCRAEVEFGFPPYMLGLRTYAVTPASPASPVWLLAAAYRRGRLALLAIDVDDGRVTDVAVPFEEVRSLQFAQGGFWFVGVSADAPLAIVRMEPGTWKWRVVRPLLSAPAWPASLAQPVRVVGRDGLAVDGHVHFPWAPSKERVPLVVNLHGGPTAMASAAFDPVAQYWARSGFAYLEINHRGSTGFGRHHREALNGAWGEAEVADSLDVVRQVCRDLPIDTARCFVRGNSAGGFSALLALLADDTFAAAGCYWGVTDLARLCANTHKFEAHYTWSLIGPYPERADEYHRRSPLTHASTFARPVIFFQGALDRIVDPEQTRSLACALEDNGVDSRYVEFPDEGHGLRRLRNLARALELEREFYLTVGLRTASSAAETMRAERESAQRPALPEPPEPNDWLRGLKRYVPGAAHARLAAGSTRLCSNENPYGGEARLQVLMRRAPDWAPGRYPDNAYTTLREALAEYFAVEPAQILVGNGSSELVTLVARAFLAPGRRAVQSAYTFSLFGAATAIAGARMTTVPSRDYAHAVRELGEAAVGANVLFVDTPCNPTGRYLDAPAMDALLAAAPSSTLVVVDEAYAEYVAEDDFRSAVSMIGRHPNVVVVRTFSKAYGLAGLRLGYCIADERVVEILERVRAPFGVNALMAAVAVEALADQGFVETCVARNASERARLERHPGVARLFATSSHANFVLLRTDGAGALHHALESHDVHVRAFADDPHHLRVTVGTPEENERFLEVFELVNKD
jgi:histidinol-phosphate aminotransferase